MKSNKINISVLTSGRSDFSHYLPIISKINLDKRFNLKIVVYGSHLSKFFGNTKNEIIKQGFDIYEEIDTMLSSDSIDSISSSMGLTSIKFSDYWKNNHNDIVLIIGDRYELFSAISVSVPYNIKIAHIHGGERTEGAIDDKFRDSITRFSSLHFTSTKNHKKRVIEILGMDYKNNVFNVGAPCIDNLYNLELYSKNEFLNYINYNFKNSSYVLATIHPETINELNNNLIISLTKKFISLINLPILFTLPNNDSGNHKLRDFLFKIKRENNNIILKDSLGSKGYYSALKHCDYVFGNSSSGIVEAAQFKKFVINIGERQKGRESGKNVFNIMKQNELNPIINKINKNKIFRGKNIFYNGGASKKIIEKIIHFYS